MIIDNPLLKEDENKCEICNKTLSSKSNLKKHIKEVHNKGAHTYIKHEKDGGKYVCKICRDKFPHSSRLKLHYKKKHLEEEVKD